MKIAIDCRFIGKSGIGTYIENIVDRMLTEHQDNQYVLICEDGETLMQKENVEIIETKIAPFSVRELLFFPIERINSCDLFFSPYINIPGGIKIPIYSTIHDCVFFDIDGLVSPLGKILRRYFYKRAVRISNKIFTVSKFSKERILYHFSTKKEIIVTGNGVTRVMQNFKRDNIVKKDYFIYVGNIKKHKGLHILVSAYARACDHGLKTKLVIVGSNENFRSSDTELATMIASLPNVEFTGMVTNQKLMSLISEAQALVQPSLYEGFGIPPLEALYLGTNVFLSDIPVFKEIYSDLPVSFFPAGDVYSLCELLLRPLDNYIDPSVRSNIDERFDYGNVTETILNCLS